MTRLMTQRRKWLSVVMVCCIFVFVASCSNLRAVHEWSRTSLEATQFNGIVANYANTPERLKKYDPAGPYDSQIALRKNQANALGRVLSVVSDYMAALTTLSADGTVNYSRDVDSLTASIVKLNVGISNDTVGAVGSLVRIVLGAAAKAYQAKQVASIVEKANCPLQSILRGELRQIIDQDFRRDLKIEKASLDRYYDSLLQDGKPSAAAKAALGEWKEARLEQNAKRLAAIDAYLTILDKVAEGHQKLYDNRHKLDAEALIKDLYSLVGELRQQIAILVKS